MCVWVKQGVKYSSLFKYTQVSFQINSGLFSCTHVSFISLFYRSLLSVFLIGFFNTNPHTHTHTHMKVFVEWTSLAWFHLRATLTHTHTHIHICTTPPLPQSHTHKFTYKHTHTHKCRHSWNGRLWRRCCLAQWSLAYMHTYAHNPTPTHTQTHTRTPPHTHTHTGIYGMDVSDVLAS